MFRMGVAVALALFAGIAAAQDATAFKTEKEKISYALGMDLAEKIKAQRMEIDAAFLARAIRDSLAGAKTLLTEEEKQSTLTALQKDLRAKQAEARRAQAEGNLEEGAAFLAYGERGGGRLIGPNAALVFEVELLSIKEPPAATAP